MVRVRVRVRPCCTAWLYRQPGGSDLGQLAPRRPLSAPDRAPGYPTPRPAKQDQPPGRRWPATSAVGLHTVPHPPAQSRGNPAGPASAPRLNGQKTVESAALEAACSSTRGSGGTPQWPGLSPWLSRAARSRQARPEEAGARAELDTRVPMEHFDRAAAPPSSSEGSSGRSRAAAVSSPHSRIILKTSAVGTWVHTVAAWMPTVAASRLG